MTAVDLSSYAHLLILPFENLNSDIVINQTLNKNNKTQNSTITILSYGCDIKLHFVGDVNVTKNTLSVAKK